MMSDSSPAPLPQPSGATCPNCGAALPAGTARCSDCGAPIGSRAPSALSSIAKVVVSIFLTLVALGLGAFAACLPMLEGIGSGSPNHTTSSGTIFVMGAALLMVGGCIWGIFRINRKP